MVRNHHHPKGREPRREDPFDQKLGGSDPQTYRHRYQVEIMVEVEKNRRAEDPNHAVQSPVDSEPGCERDDDLGIPRTGRIWGYEAPQAGGQTEG